MNQAHASTLAASVALTSTPYWVSVLQQVNLILGTAAAIMGLLVGGITLYEMLKARRRKP